MILNLCYNLGLWTDYEECEFGQREEGSYHF